MRNNNVITKPIKIKDISFEDLFKDFSYDSELKLRRVRAQQQRSLKRNLIDVKS